MKQQPKYRLRGATLVEVLVAMSLVSVVFVIGSQTLLQVNGHQSPHREQQYRLEARRLIQELEQGNLSEEVIHFGAVDFLVERKPVYPRRNLFEGKIKCLDQNGQLLFSRQKIIRLP